MLHVLIGFALVPFALVGLLVLLGVLVLTWRYLIAALLFLLLVLGVFATTSFELWIQVLIIYLAVIVIFAVAHASSEEVSDDQQVILSNEHTDIMNFDRDKVPSRVADFINQNGRFTFFQIRKLMDNKSETMEVINYLTSNGYVAPEGLRAPMHWKLRKSI